MIGTIPVDAETAIAEDDNLRLENAWLKSEVARLSRSQQTAESSVELNYAMKRAKCLLWHSSIEQWADPLYLEWTVKPISSDWAQSFFPIKVLEGEDYWQAFYRARLTEDLEPAGERNAAAIRAGKDYESEFRAIDAAGNLRWIHESVRVEIIVPSYSWRAVGLCTDITAKKEMELKIENRDELLRVAVEVSGLDLIVIDSEHRYRYVNRKHGNYKGISDLDMLGKTISEVFEPKYAAGFTENLERVLRGERIQHHQIFESLIENGPERHFDVAIEPAVDQSGPLAVVILADVSERVQREEETRRLKIEAEKRATILSTARQVALDILLSRSGAEVLRHIADAARQLAGAEYAAIAIENAAEIDLPGIISAGLTVAEDKAISLPWFAELSLDFIKEHADKVWSSSYPSSPEPMPWLNYPTVSGHVTGIPIVQDGNAIGALFVGGAPESTKFSDAEAGVAALADYAAVAIHYQRQLKQQRSLTHGFVNLLEQERRSVAYEVHDGLTQHLMAANAFLDSYCDSNTKTDSASALNLEQAVIYLRIAVQESRRLINGLSALTLDDIGLPGSLRQLMNEQAELAGWQKADFVHNTGGRRYGIELETAVYRIAQEALANVRKHAGSDRVSIQLHESQTDDANQLLALTIQDWGSGFDPRTVATEYGHVGLRSMNERSNLLDGVFTVDSAPGAGTRISAEFKLSP